MDSVESQIAKNNAIKLLIDQLNVKGILHAYLNPIDQSDAMDGDKPILIMNLTAAFNRLAYDLFYLLRQEDKKITKLHLQILVEVIGDVCEKDYIGFSFNDLGEWDSQINNILIAGEAFQSQKSEKIGKDYIDEITLQAVLDNKEKTEVDSAIEALIAGIRIEINCIFIAGIDQFNCDNMIGAMEAQYENRWEELSSAERFYRFLFSEIDRVCKELCFSTKEILQKESEIRKIMPKALDKYLPLLDRYALVFLEFMSDKPCLGILNQNSILQAWITRYLEAIKNLVDAETGSEEDLYAAWSTGSMTKGDYGSN